MRYTIYPLISLMICLSIEPVNGQTVNDANSHGVIQLDPDVRYGKLANGFTYYIRRNDVPKGKIEMRLIVNAGYNNEDADQLGLAHLMEHMAFNGTTNYPDNSLREYFDKMGLIPGNSWNAHTYENSTTFELIIPENNSELFKNSFGIFRDWAQGLTLDPKAVDEERGVLLAEMRNGESSVFKNQLEMEKAVLNHPKFPTDLSLRIKENTRTFKYESLLRFYKEWYRPDLQALVVVGNVDVNEIEEKITSYFSDIKKPDKPARVLDVDEYRYKVKEKSKLIILPNDEISGVRIVIYEAREGKQYSLKTVDDYRSETIDKLYNVMIRRRLESFQEQYNLPFLEVAHQLNRYAIGGHYARLDALYTSIKLDPRQSIEKAFKATFSELERVNRYGFLQTEFSYAKEVILNVYKQHTEAPTSELIDKYEKHFTAGTAAPNPKYEFDLKLSLIEGIKLEEINHLLSNWSKAVKSLNVAIIAPSKLEHSLPNEKILQAWLTEIESNKPERYKVVEIMKEKLVSEDGLKKLTVNAVPFEKRNIEEINITEIKLANGTRVILKPFKPQGFNSDKIIISGFRLRDVNSYTWTEYLMAKSAAEIVLNSGVGHFNKFKLKKYLADRDIWAGPEIDEKSENIGGGCSAKDIEILLQVIYLYFTSPRKDTLAFEDWKRTKLIELGSWKTDPVNIFSEVSRRRLFYNDTDKPKADEQFVNSISLDKVYEVYKERFSNPGSFTFTVTGDFDREEIIPLLLKYFGSLPAKVIEKPLKELLIHPILKSVDTSIYLGTNQRGDVQLFFPGIYEPGLVNQLKLRIINAALQIKMTERLRELEGGVYTVNTGVYSKDRIKFYRFSVGFVCDPENVEKMIACTLEEFNKLKNNGLNDELFKAAIAQINEHLSYRLQSQEFWPIYLKEKYLHNDNPAEILMHKTILEDILTLDQINKAAKVFLTAENFQRYVLLPKSFKPGSKVQ